MVQTVTTFDGGSPRMAVVHPKPVLSVVAVVYKARGLTEQMEQLSSV